MLAKRYRCCGDGVRPFEMAELFKAVACVITTDKEVDVDKG